MRKIFLTVCGLMALAGAALASPLLMCQNSGGSVDLVNDGCISGTSRHYPGGGLGPTNDHEADVESQIQFATGLVVDLTLYDKSDDGSPLVTVTGDPGKVGTWDAGTQFISYITVKAANSFAIYEVNSTSGTWTTAGIKNNGGNQPDVSHISFWTTDRGPQNPVPEPATWAMMIAGGVLVAARKYAARRA